MTEYLHKEHKCTRCDRIHYCPDGCFKHTDDFCICTRCGLEMTFEEIEDYKGKKGVQDK